ncbi:hypothetical protein NL676_006509 [Syzygium grande]|nr:hypothetical protein NL676_006509 [Syzygium grande]
MATESSGSQSRELDQTPTWAVAGVCALIILISIALEKVLHKVGTWLTERHKKALFEALEKIKCELMILGFISLLLTFGQSYIAKICIPTSVAETMLPCDKKTMLLIAHREPPLISVNGLHQLHILIFFLAFFHVLYSAVTMMLGRLKIRGWKQWEQETSSHDYEFSTDPSRFRLTHETSFVKVHSSFWTRIPFFFYVGCFFRQFFRSVHKTDYLTLRNGFIAVHIAPGGKFNFQKYIKRSLEDDFKFVVGVSPVLWASFVIFLLLNVNDFQGSQEVAHGCEKEARHTGWQIPYSDVRSEPEPKPKPVDRAIFEQQAAPLKLVHEHRWAQEIDWALGSSMAVKKTQAHRVAQQSI